MRTGWIITTGCLVFSRKMTDTKDKVISILCLIFGIASYPLICRWYLGVAAAILSIVLFFYHSTKYERNRMTTAGAVLGLTLIILFIITAASFGAYMSLVSGGDDVNWDKITDSLQFGE